ncbi:MAG: hypothetical protein ACP5N1_04370 [Candidatus Woesearchaeota archaeon]
MKSIHKLYMILFLSLTLLVSISCVNAAVIYGGKVYSGDAFSSNIGGNFNVRGLDVITLYDNMTGDIFHYKKILIESDVDTSVVIRNGTCVSTNMYNYCYRESVLDVNNLKTYDDDGLWAGMSITIESLPNPTSIVIFSRDMIINSYCGAYIPMSININNSGTLSTNITYSELLPENTIIVNSEKGLIELNTITFYDTLGANTSKNYTYTLANIDCSPKQFNAVYTLTSFNETITKTLNNISIFVNQSYNFTNNISKNKTNILNEDIVYDWTIKNIHPSLVINSESQIILPKELIVTQMSPDIRYSNGIYYYSKSLGSDAKMNLFIKFHPEKYGLYKIVNKGTISIEQNNVVYYSNNSIIVAPPTVNALININTSSNNLIYVSVDIINNDISEKYYYIYGFLKGISEDEPLYANSIDPDSTVNIANRTYDITGKNNLTLVFDGIYRDKNSVESKIYASRTVVVNGSSVIVEEIVDDFSTEIINDVLIVNTTNTNTDTNTNADTGTNNPDDANDSKDDIDIEKVDILTRMVIGLNNFLQSVFG